VKFIALIKKIYKIGLIGSSKIAKERIRKKYFHTCFYKRALTQKAGHTWGDIIKKNNTNLSLTAFFENAKNTCHVFNITQKFTHEKFLEIIEQADKYIENKFNLLGSGEVKFKNIDWHLDFRLKNKNKNTILDSSFYKNKFYSEIKIEVGKNDNKEAKDIKVPWELSRFYHLPLIGKAYEQTLDEKYTCYFVEHITDWLEHNPFLLGTNWVCPMEVSIRAINLAHAFYFFIPSKKIDSHFWQKLICSLYDHFIFIEHNWEISNLKTSNHYLSNLLGYFYLCIFFKNFKKSSTKLDWCYNEMLKELDKQVFDEGTSYEGSSAYHKFITEIFIHFYLLCENIDFKLPQKYIDKIYKMITFIDWCTNQNNNFVLIGDNDSGSILHPLLFSRNIIFNTSPNIQKPQNPNTKIFEKFGLSIIKTQKYHITLRHHAYQNNQPSGHFHNDAGSLTLSIDGSPILIDPGSYLYTPSEYWRNQFRSVHSHNTFFIKDTEPVPFDDKIFELNIPESTSFPHHLNKNKNQIKTSHNLYNNFGLIAKRSVSLDNLENIITIEDNWSKINPQEKNLELTSQWQFILAPQVISIKKDNYIELNYNKNYKIYMASEHLDFKIINGWESLQYGEKIKTKKLVAYSKIFSHKKFIIFFYLNEKFFAFSHL